MSDEQQTEKHDVAPAAPAETATTRKHLPVTVRVARQEDIPQIHALNSKFVASGHLCYLKDPEFWSRIIAAEECVVAELVASPPSELSGIVVAYSCHRTSTGVKEETGMLAQHASILMRVHPDYKGKKIGFGVQTAVDDVAQGSNVQRELIAGLAKHSVAQGYSHFITSILKSNERSVKVALEKDGSTIIAETPDGKCLVLLSRDLNEIV